jgi:hypothetical protein
MGKIGKALEDPSGEALVAEWERRISRAKSWEETVTHLPGAKAYLSKKRDPSLQPRLKAIAEAGVLRGAAIRSIKKLTG